MARYRTTFGSAAARLRPSTSLSPPALAACDAGPMKVKLVPWTDSNPEPTRQSRWTCTSVARPDDSYTWRQVELDPLRENAHRQLMRLLALSGQQSAALAQYETYRRLLVTELGVEPSEEIQAATASFGASSMAAQLVSMANPVPPSLLTRTWSPTITRAPGSICPATWPV